MPDTREKYFFPKPASFSNRLFFDVGSTLIIIQPDLERRFEKQILNKYFYNMADLKKNNASDFETKFSQRFRFLISKFCNASDSGLKENTTR